MERVISPGEDVFLSVLVAGIILEKKKTHPKYLSYITLTSGPATVIRPFSLIFFKIETGR